MFWYRSKELNLQRGDSVWIVKADIVRIDWPQEAAFEIWKKQIDIVLYPGVINS